MKKILSLSLTLTVTLALLSVLFVTPVSAEQTLDSMVAGATQYSITDGTAMTAQYGTPTIDGEFDEVWGTTEWYVNDAQSLHLNNSGSTAKAYCAYLWDENNYYGFVYVTDSKAVGKAGYVSVGFDVGRLHDTTIPVGDAEFLSPYLWQHEVNLPAGNTDSVGWNWCYKGFVKESVDFAQCFVSKKISDNAYALEYCFPVNKVMSSKSDQVGQVLPNSDGSYEIEIKDYTQNYKNKTGDTVGVNLEIRETGSNDFKLSWPYTWSTYDKPNQWPAVTLQGEAPNQGGTDTDPGTGNGGGQGDNHNADTSDMLIGFAAVGTLALAGTAVVLRKKH